jgi:hypothetical protein
VKNATRPTLALKKKSKYLRTLNILLAGGFSPKAKSPTKPYIFSCLGAKLDPDCYSLIYQEKTSLLLVFSCPALLLGAKLTSLAGQAIVNSPAFRPTPIETVCCGDSRLSS